MLYATLTASSFYDFASDGWQDLLTLINLLDSPAVVFDFAIHHFACYDFCAGKSAEDCIYRGKYCGFRAPHQAVSESPTGADLIKSSLLLKCAVQQSFSQFISLQNTMKADFYGTLAKMKGDPCLFEERAQALLAQSPEQAAITRNPTLFIGEASVFEQLESYGDAQVRGERL